MKRYVVTAVTLLSLAAGTAPSSAAPNAPMATLSASTGSDLDWQMSSVIYSSWDGEEYDDSEPPVEWPKAMKTSATELTIAIASSDMPESVEVRMWKRVRANGLPEGKRKKLECRVGELSECSLEPSVTPQGRLQWSVTFEPPWSAHTYIATLGNWPDAQVAYINHAFIER